MKEFFPGKPSPKKDAQMDLPISKKNSQEQLDLPGFGPLKGDELNWGPMDFITNEKINPNEWNSDYKDVEIEFREGKWFVDRSKNPIPFEEIKDILKSTKNNGLALALRNKKFKRIFSYFENLEN